MIDEHLSKGARLDGSYLRAEDVSLKERVAAALQLVTPHQAQAFYLDGRHIRNSDGRTKEQQNYFDRIPNRYLGRITYNRAIIPNCGDYRDPILYSAKTMAEMEIASRGKSLNGLMYFDAAEECFERSPDQEKKPSPELPPPAKKLKKETEDNKLLEKCPINHKSNINPATKHKIRRLIDAPAMPIPDIGIQSATKADVWRLIHLVCLTVNAPPLSTEMFIAIRFHLFMLWAKRWDMVPWKHLTEERTKLHALISMSEEASVHECLYMSVKQLEDSDPQHGARITNHDWKFGDAVIFLPIHPLPHLLRRDIKPSAVELWKVMDYPAAETLATTRVRELREHSHRAAIMRMCDLFLTDWTPYINGTNDPAASDFGRGSDNSAGGLWRFTVQGLCLRWLSLPREINSLAHRLSEPSISISTFWDGTTVSAYNSWKDHMEQRPLAMDEFEKKCEIGYLLALDEDLRPANSQQGRGMIEDQNYENQSPPSRTGEDHEMTAASDESMSDPINAAETRPHHTMFSGDEQAFSMSMVTENDEAGHIQPGGQTINNDQEKAEPESESGGTAEVSPAPITETVGVEHGDLRPSPLNHTQEDVDMLASDPDTTSSQTPTPALQDDDDRNPRGKSDELGDHDVPTTGGTPQMQSLEDMTTSTNNGEPSSEVGDIQDRPVKGMKWRRVVPWGRLDGLGDDVVEGWI